MIRFANLNDTEEILNIYATYVKNTIVSFEYEVPSILEFEKRIISISETLPYIVYEVDKKIVGYAYASKHAQRAAYCYDVDLSVYIDSNYHGKKIGTELYNTLFSILKQQGYYNAYAAIAIPNDKSINFHKSHGFKEVGIYHNIGYKFNKWIDLIWLEKNLIDYNIPPKSIKNIKEIKI